MTYKQIEASRELRLWIGQVIVPATVAVMAISPEARQAVANKATSVKNSIKNTFKKKDRA